MTHDAYSTKKVTLWQQDRDGTPGYSVKYQDGYLSWAPADIIARDYQPIDAMSFGHAIHALKAGHRVARSGWNGKGMFIYLNKGSFDRDMLGFNEGEQPHPGHPSTIDGVRLDMFEAGDVGTVTRLPNINMRSASGATVTGWLASQTDMLADDWQII